MARAKPIGLMSAIILAQWLVGLGLLGAGLVQAWYWAFVLGRWRRWQPQQPPAQAPFPISVVICARNEAENLRRHLPPILEQDYPDFELVLVNDASSDDSGAVLADLAARYPHLRVIHKTERGKAGKKHALALGILAARHEWLLLSDADCAPCSPHWISGMQAHAQGSTEIVLGYAPFYRRPGFFNAFNRYECLYTALQYTAFALWGKPYMGVGRNLMYQKRLFEATEGFSQHEHIASGDDDLFVNAVAHAGNVALCPDPRTFMYSEAKPDWRSYVRQKQRHLSTGRYYRLEHQIWLGLLSASHAGLYVLSFVEMVFLGCHVLETFAILGLVLGLKAGVYRRAAQLLRQDDLRWTAIVFDVLFVAYYAAFTPTLIKGRTDKW